MQKSQLHVLAFSKWFVANNLRLNSGKTKFILFRMTAKTKETLNIQIHEGCISVVDSVKLLGIHIDSYLYRNGEVNVGNNISSDSALRCIKEVLSMKQLIMVYYFQLSPARGTVLNSGETATATT